MSPNLPWWLSTFRLACNICKNFNKMSYLHSWSQGRNIDKNCQQISSSLALEFLSCSHSSFSGYQSSHLWFSLLFNDNSLLTETSVSSTGYWFTFNSMTRSWLHAHVQYLVSYWDRRKDSLKKTQTSLC